MSFQLLLLLTIPGPEKSGPRPSSFSQGEAGRGCGRLAESTKSFYSKSKRKSEIQHQESARQAVSPKPNLVSPVGHFQRGSSPRLGPRVAPEGGGLSGCSPERLTRPPSWAEVTKAPAAPSGREEEFLSGKARREGKREGREGRRKGGREEKTKNWPGALRPHSRRLSPQAKVTRARL